MINDFGGISYVSERIWVGLGSVMRDVCIRHEMENPHEKSWLECLHLKHMNYLDNLATTLVFYSILSHNLGRSSGHHR